MFILNTIAHNTIWGGTKLVKLTDGSEDRVGHLYSVIGTAEKSCNIISGSNRGKSLYDWFLDNRSRFGWENIQHFPITTALVDAAQDLSIQVHPDDETAAKLENGAVGKNESFYFITAPEDGKMVCACACNTFEEFLDRVNNKDFDSIIGTIDVKSGDYVYVPAGTLHSLSAGSLVYEIEEACELTYRVYDYGRLDDNGNLRPLHIEKSIASIHVENRGIVKSYAKEPVIEEKKYFTSLIKGAEKYSNTSNRPECLTLLAGKVTIDGVDAIMGNTIILEPGETLNQPVELAVMARPK